MAWVAWVVHSSFFILYYDYESTPRPRRPPKSLPRRKKMPTRRPRRPPTTNAPAVKLEADFNPSMSGLLARETADAERRASRKRSRLIKTLIERGDRAAVIDLTTFRERVATPDVRIGSVRIPLLICATLKPPQLKRGGMAYA